MESNYDYNAETTEALELEKDGFSAEAETVGEDAVCADETPDEAKAAGDEKLEVTKENTVSEKETAGDEKEPEDHEEEEPQIPVLPLPDPVSDFRGGISAFGFSQQGKSHVNKGVPCQDRSALRFLSDTVIAAAIADGVGSCALSDHGADTAVTSSLDYLEEHLGEKLKTPGFVLDVAFMGKLLREMMQNAYDQVAKRAQQMEQLLYSMQSTLTVAVYDGKTLYFAHAGDDGIVAQTRKGDYEMVTTRHKGDEASSVYPLQSCNTWQYGMVNDVVGFVMATDGVLDAFVRSEVEKNRVYYPFVEPAFFTELKNAEETAAACSDWFAYMQDDKYRATVTDDLSFVCIVNQDAIKEAVKPVFDMELWNKETQEYAARRKAALYPPKQPETQKKASADVAKDPSTAQQGARDSAAENAQRSAPVNPSSSHHNAGHPVNRPRPNPATPQANNGAQQSQLSRNGNGRENLNELYVYGRKVVAGIGGLLLVGSEMLVDFAGDAVQRARDYIDDELENRSNRYSNTAPGYRERSEGNDTEGE